MGLLDKPTVTEEVQAIRKRRANEEMRLENLRLMGKMPWRDPKKPKRKRA